MQQGEESGKEDDQQVRGVMREQVRQEVGRGVAQRQERRDGERG